MSVGSLVLVAAAGLVCGGVLGFVSGFGMASHADVLRGVRPMTKNRAILFLARPSSEIRGAAAIFFFLLLLCGMALFLVLCAAPVLLAERLSLEGNAGLLASIAPFAVGMWLGRQFGAQAWRVLT